MKTISVKDQTTLRRLRMDGMRRTAYIRDLLIRGLNVGEDLMETVVFRDQVKQYSDILKQVSDILKKYSDG